MGTRLYRETSYESAIKLNGEDPAPGMTSAQASQSSGGRFGLWLLPAGDHQTGAEPAAKMGQARKRQERYPSILSRFDAPA